MSETIEIRDPEINVDQIMNRISNSIEEKKKSQVYIEEPWMLQDISQPHMRLDMKRASDTLAMLKIAGRLDLEGEPISSHRMISGYFIKLLKKVTRFWTRKYTDAIFFKQNHFNMELVNIISQMNEQIHELKQEIVRLKKESPNEDSAGDPEMNKMGETE